MRWASIMSEGIVFQVRLAAVFMSMASAAIVASAQLPCCAGAGGTYDFSIRSVTRSGGGFRVLTKGASFDISGSRVKCYQTIGKLRCVAVVQIPVTTKQEWVQLPGDDKYESSFSSGTGVVLTVTGDSVMRVHGPDTLSVSPSDVFKAEFRERAEASAVFADESGGVGIYGPKGARIDIAGMEKGVWRVKYPQLANDPLLEETDVLISVFPPRPFEWEKASKDVMVHFFPRWIKGVTCKSDAPYPTDDELVQWREFANILVLHAETWSTFGSKNIQPQDPARFAEVMRKARELGWKVIVYTSPFYFHGDLREFESEIAHIMSYGLDGLYWDYTAVGVEAAWKINKFARKAIGDKLLYLHLTQTPSMNYRMLVPFADTYADYILRGENKSWTQIDAAYLRYLVSGYGLSNSIGTLCYESCRINPEIIQATLGVNARLTYWAGSQHNTDNNRDYFLTPAESKLFLEDYLPASQKPAGVLKAAFSESMQARQRDVRSYYAERAKKRKALEQYLSDRAAAMKSSNSSNLAAFKPAICSDVSASEAAMHGLGPVAQYATDCNENTYWAADLAPQWIEVDLLKCQPVSCVVVRNVCLGDGRYYHYKVLASNDRKKWTVVGSKMSDSAATRDGDTLQFPRVRARYVRVVMLRNSANIGLHISEIEIYNR